MIFTITGGDQTRGDQQLFPAGHERYQKPHKHVVILGGGFAGVQAAIELKKQKRFTVTLL